MYLRSSNCFFQCFHFEFSWKSGNLLQQLVQQRSVGILFPRHALSSPSHLHTHPARRRMVGCVEHIREGLLPGLPSPRMIPHVRLLIRQQAMEILRERLRRTKVLHVNKGIGTRCMFLYIRCSHHLQAIKVCGREIRRNYPPQGQTQQEEAGRISRLRSHVSRCSRMQE